MALEVKNIVIWDEWDGVVERIDGKVFLVSTTFPDLQTGQTTIPKSLMIAWTIVAHSTKSRKVYLYQWRYLCRSTNP